MKAIQTRYLPVTRTKPARIKAWSGASKILTISTHSAYLETASTEEEQHILVAHAYAAELNWNGPLITGYLPNGDYCHVFAGGAQNGNS